MFFISTVVQDAACKKINNVLVDTSDLAISQYSLLGQTPPPSAPDSPATLCKDSSPAVKDQTQPEEALEEQPIVLDSQDGAYGSENSQQDPTSLYPLIVVTQQLNGSPTQEGKTSEEVPLHTDIHPTTAESDIRQEDGDPPETPANPQSPEPSEAPPRSNAKCFQEPSSPELSASEHLLESSEQQPSADSLVNIRLGFLSQAIAAPPELPAQRQGPTDRAVYLSGKMKDNWEVERVEEQEEAKQAEVQGTRQEEPRGTGVGEEKTGEGEGGAAEETVGQSAEDIGDSEALEWSVATKKEVGEEKEEDKKQQMEDEEKDNAGRREYKEEKEKEKKEEQREDNDREKGQKYEEEDEEQKESKEEKQKDRVRGGKCKKEKEQKEKEEEQREKKEKQEQQEDGGQGGECQEEKEKGKKANNDRGQGEKHEEDNKEEQKEEQEKIGGQGGKNEEEKEQEEKKEDDGGQGEKQEKQKKESNEEKQHGEVQNEDGGQAHEKVVPDRPLVEPGPDSIAAIRALVSEVIEVEVEIGQDPDLLQGLPASCNVAL